MTLRSSTIRCMTGDVAAAMERVREFVMLRIDNEDGGDQKYYTYFKRPSDVSRLTFMVHKNTGGNDARWIYVPSVDLIKPISADDKNSSFVGSDFSYEDVSGRHWTEDTHTLTGAQRADRRYDRGPSLAARHRGRHGDRRHRLATHGLFRLVTFKCFPTENGAEKEADHDEHDAGEDGREE